MPCLDPPAGIAAARARLCDALCAPGAHRAIAAILHAHLPPPGGGPILDLGCGASARVRRPDVVGADIDLRALRAYARRAPAVAADAAALSFRDRAFAAVFSVGLLHHLGDRAVRQAVAEMLRVTAPGGRVIVFDGLACSTPVRRPLAAAIRALDRGAHLRSAEELAGLLGQAAAWDIAVRTYAATGLEGLVGVHQKGDA